jgi:hypothetical protein
MRWRLGELRFKASLGTKLARPHLKHKPSMMFQICNLSYDRGIGERIKVFSQPQAKKQDP